MERKRVVVLLLLVVVEAKSANFGGVFLRHKGVSKSSHCNFCMKPLSSRRQVLEESLFLFVFCPFPPPKTCLWGKICGIIPAPSLFFFLGVGWDFFC